MKRLDDVGKSWRDYLYANHDGEYNDPKDFMVRVSIIYDCQEQVLDAMLEDNPDMASVKESKEEIVFQREALEDIAEEFVAYHNSNLSHKLKIEKSIILYMFCKRETENYFYQIAEEWESLGEKAHSLWEKLGNSYGSGLIYIHEDLCKLIMEEYKENEDK